MLDQLLLSVLFLLALLVRFILSLFTERPGTHEPEKSAPGAPTPPPPPLPLPPARPPVRVAPSRSPAPERPARAPIVTVAPVWRRQRLLPQLQRQDARRGVILMTILGPCRALEPASPPQQ